MTNAIRAMLFALAFLIATPLCVLAHKNQSAEEATTRNLGPLGGTAKLVDDPRRGAKSGLEVTSVQEDLPAHTAGLRVGDVIVGISAGGGAKYFDRDAYAELGKAITEAESKRKGRPADLRLCVVRDGKDEQVKVELMGWGSDATKFPQGAMGDEVAGAALKFLADSQLDDGSWESTNRTSRIVQTSLCGLAFLAGGHTPASGTYKSNVRHAAKYVMDNVELPCSATVPNDGCNYNMSNWSLGYAGIFLAELYRAAPQPGLDKTLESIRDRLEANMEASGGFAHGPGGPNEMGYTEIAMTSNLCLLALGALQSTGFKVDSRKIELAKSYLETCTESNGGVGYGAQPRGRSRYVGCVGRTAGAMLAFNAVGDNSSRQYRTMVKFFGRSRGMVLDGHVSASMHYLSVAAASYKLGKKDWAEFWDTYRGEFTMLRTSDGSITGRWTEDSRKLGYCPDLKYGDVWCTAHWAIILNLPKDNLPVLLGNKGKPKYPAK